VSVDLDSLWSQLGIQLDGSGVRFDDGAKLAVRQIELVTGAIWTLTAE